jgi:TBC1 domain family member 25
MNAFLPRQAIDLLFCYRWLLLEMKREFAFDEALRMLEVTWSSLPKSPRQDELGN